jgi:hypothetical protein
MEIIEYLPKNDQDNISLTSKRLYEVVCEMEMFWYPLVINAETVSENISLK